ncbi:MAG: HAMP domain-containing sensor histidine kinase [Deltaproteobacteria bacterium]
MNGDELEESVRSAGEGPEAGFRAAGELAGELVHALRNPVAGFSTSLDLLLSGRLDAEDVTAIHGVLRNELRKMNDTLARTADVARLGSLQRVPVDLAALVAKRLDARAKDLAMASVVLERRVAPGPVPVRADAMLLGDAIDALLQNALDAMADRGGALAVSLVVEPGGAVIRVRDTGRGVPEVIRANVFRPFFTTRKGAAGMGLSLARWIARGHSGDVTLVFGESGTEAVLTVPVEPDPYSGGHRR